MRWVSLPSPLAPPSPTRSPSPWRGDGDDAPASHASARHCNLGERGNKKPHELTAASPLRWQSRVVISRDHGGLGAETPLPSSRLLSSLVAFAENNSSIQCAKMWRGRGRILSSPRNSGHERRPLPRRFESDLPLDARAACIVCKISLRVPRFASSDRSRHLRSFHLFSLN